MKHSKLSRFVLATNLVICSVWLMLLLHVDSLAYKPLLWTMPMLRMWLSLLMYRRSRMALVPLLFLVILSFMTIWDHGNTFFLLFNRPMLAVVKSAMAFFSVGSFDLAEFSDLLYSSWEHKYWIAGIASIWVIVAPTSAYAYRCFKREFIPSQLSLWKRMGLVLYLLAMMAVMSVFIGEMGVSIVSVLVLGIMLMLIPVIFNKRRLEGLLTRFEQTFIISFLMFGMAYACGESYNAVSSLTTVALPAAFLALVNWNMGRKTDYTDVILLVSGSAVFYIAQYSFEMIRVILLLMSLGLFAVAIARFAYSTKKYWASVALYVMLALIIPVFCIGYNPYSVLEARMVRKFDDYNYSRIGLMLVTGPDGDGIRDRYGLILPAEYYDIHLLLPSKPYCIVRKLGGWKIYDIEKHMLLSDEEFADVIPYGRNAFLLKSSERDKYLRIPHMYNRFSDRGDAIITDESPFIE